MTVSSTSESQHPGRGHSGPSTGPQLPTPTPHSKTREAGPLQSVHVTGRPLLVHAPPKKWLKPPARSSSSTDVRDHLNLLLCHQKPVPSFRLLSAHREENVLGEYGWMSDVVPDKTYLPTCLACTSFQREKKKKVNEKHHDRKEH